MSKKLLFAHVPKVGGTSLHLLFEQLIGRDLVYRLRAGHKAGRTDLAGLSADERARHQFFQGHFSFGEHRRFEQPCIYLAVVRDPIDRLISLYHYLRDQQRSDLHPGVEIITFTQFCAEITSNFKSGWTQCGFLTGCNDVDDIKAVLDQHYLTVCTTRQLNDMQTLLLNLYGSQPQPPLHRNPRRGALVDREEAAAARRRYSQFFSFDYWLVDHVEERFFAQCEALGVQAKTSPRRKTHDYVMKTVPYRVKRAQQ
ncbi:MAG: sulfotransferase family 2 domain-containing protein [Pseudomonadota bacterium]